MGSCQGKSATETAEGSGNIPAQSPSPAQNQSSAQPYTAAEVAKHNTAADCWVIINDKIYNVTKFISSHPGGERVILSNAGQNCSSIFSTMHSTKAKAMLPKYFVADLQS